MQQLSRIVIWWKYYNSYGTYFRASTAFDIWWEDVINIVSSICLQLSMTNRNRITDDDMKVGIIMELCNMLKVSLVYIKWKDILYNITQIQLVKGRKIDSKASQVFTCYYIQGHSNVYIAKSSRSWGIWKLIWHLRHTFLARQHLKKVSVKHIHIRGYHRTDTTLVRKRILLLLDIIARVSIFQLK